MTLSTARMPTAALILWLMTAAVALGAAGLIIWGVVTHNTTTKNQARQELVILTPEEATQALAKQLASMTGSRESMMGRAEFDVAFDPNYKQDEDATELLSSIGVSGGLKHVHLTMSSRATNSGDHPASQVTGELSVEADQVHSLGGFDVITLNELVYAKLIMPETIQTQLQTAFKQESDIDIDFGFLLNTWIKIDPVKLGKQLGSTYGSYLTQAQSFVPTASEQATLQESLTKHPVVILTEGLGTEMINAVPMTKYQARFDLANFKLVMHDLRPFFDRVYTPLGIDVDDMFAETDALKESDFSSEELSTIFETFVWIDQTNQRLGQIEVTMKPAPGIDAEGVTGMDLLMNYQSINDVTIEAPADTVSLESIIGEAVIEFGGAVYRFNQKHVDTPSTTVNPIEVDK